MLFFDIIAYVLFAYGFANMVVYANGPFGIFERWRNFTHGISEGFGELFTCMICLSTWIGAVFSALDFWLVTTADFTPFNIVFGERYPALTIFMDMCATSGAVWLLHNLEEAFERHWNYGDDN